MQSGRQRSWAALAGLLAVANSAAAPFQNLDFEQANTNHLSSDASTGVTLGPINELLPGWQVVLSRPTGIGQFPGYTNSLQFLTFNSEYFDAPNVVLTDRNWSDVGPPRVGIYSLNISPAQATVTLIQRGDVPLDAEGFRSFGIAAGIPNSFVSMNGVPLQFNGAGLDVSPYLGQNVELRITYEQGSSFFRTDGFSFYLVPEPPIWALLMVSACCFTTGFIGKNSRRRGRASARLASLA